MSAANCPSGYTLFEDTCYSVCLAGTVYPTYPEYCVSDLPCPTGTVEDATGLACTKIAPTGVQPLVGQACPNNYTEWTSGQCYINCPSYFNENGLECRKRVTIRRTTNPYCSSWVYTLNANGTCTVSGAAVIGIAVGFVLFLVILKLLTLPFANANIKKVSFEDPGPISGNPGPISGITSERPEQKIFDTI